MYFLFLKVLEVIKGWIKKALGRFKMGFWLPNKYRKQDD